MFGTLMGGGVLDLPETTGHLAGPKDRPTATGLLVGAVSYRPGRLVGQVTQRGLPAAEAGAR